MTTDTAANMFYVTFLKHAEGRYGTPIRRCAFMVYNDTSPLTAKQHADQLRAEGYNDVRVEPVRGLRSSIFRDSGFPGDYSNHGLSSRVTRVTLIGPELYDATNGSLPDAPSEQAPAVVLRETLPGHTVARPYGQHTRGGGAMFGGTFIWCSDSRFSAVHDGPIPLHDRFEGVSA